MLVLSRKANEQIRIGDDVVLTVVRLKGNQVAIGIEAPKSVRVLRGELGPEAVIAAEAPVADASGSHESKAA